MPRFSVEEREGEGREKENVWKEERRRVVDGVEEKVKGKRG